MAVQSRSRLFYASLAGICLFIVGMGINRFSYAPVVPYLINQHWVNAAQSGYIGSSSFMGYFIGAFLGHRLLRYFNLKNVMLVTLVASLLASVLCIFNVGFIWLCVWRLVAGVVAGIVIILTPTLVLQGLSEAKKVTVTGIIFAGIGIGIALTSLTIPLFNQWGGVAGIWIAFAVLTLILGLISLKKCLTATKIKSEPTAEMDLTTPRAGIKRTFGLIATAISLYGIGLAPSLLFLSDYAHRSLGLSEAVSSDMFAILGVGCIAGSMGAAWFHKRMGSYWGSLLVTFIGILGLLSAVLFKSLFGIIVSSFLTGFYLIGTITIVSVLISNMVGMSNHTKFWSLITLVYAGSQFLAGYASSYALSLGLNYRNLFCIGAGFLILSFIVYLFTYEKKQPMKLKGAA